MSRSRLSLSRAELLLILLLAFVLVRGGEVGARIASASLDTSRPRATTYEGTEELAIRQAALDRARGDLDVLHAQLREQRLEALRATARTEAALARELAAARFQRTDP
jgi:hypothetical protein